MPSMSRQTVASSIISEPLCSLSGSPSTHNGETVKPPEHLRDSRDLWERTLEHYELDIHHLKLLEAACTAYDRMTEARAILDRDGVVYHDRFGNPRKHPCVSVEQDARLAFARLIRELDLDGETVPESRLPRR
jgi:P27 family predicted phage terminase small subunit